MERTLDTVLRSIGNPSMASGMISRSPSPVPQSAQTQALMQSPSPPPQQNYPAQSTTLSSASPKLHSLPDNALNPLGLLAEASLANRRAHGITTSFTARQSDAESDRRLGVASDNYFRPGFVMSFFQMIPCHLFLARPHINLTTQTIVHRKADTTRNAELCKH